MAFTFGQLFNSQSPSGGNMDNPGQITSGGFKKRNKEWAEAKKQPSEYKTESGGKYTAANIDVIETPGHDGWTHVRGRGVEDYTTTEVRADKSGYKLIHQEIPAENKEEEYFPSIEMRARRVKLDNYVTTEFDKVVNKEIAKEKTRKIASIETGDVLEVIYAGKSTLYNITSVVDGKVTYTRDRENTPRETTVESLSKIVMGSSVEFTVIGEKEKLQLKEFEETLKALREKESKLDKTGSPLEQIEHMRDMMEEYNIPIAYIEPVYSEKEKKYQEQLQEQAQRYYEEREEVIENIGKMLRGGVDKIVIHGKTVERGDVVGLEAKFAENVDLDTRGALFLLSVANGVKYNEGSYTELTKKGQRGGNIEKDAIYFNAKDKKDRATLYIDTSGERLNYEVGAEGSEASLDHHQKHFSKYATSATELAYEVLVKNGMLERKPWLDKMVEFITSIDNLSYASHEKFNESFLEHKWPRSMYALDKSVPFEKIAEWFKEGRDPLNPEFTDSELAEVIAVKRSKDGSEKVSLGQIIEEQARRIGADISNAKFAVKVMEKRGLKLKSDSLGKVIYNKQDKQKEISEIDSRKNPINKIYNGFLVAKALGWDGYATYNEEYNRFMINTNTHDLYPAYEKLKKIVPESVLVRGVMLMQPPGISNRKNITEDKFLEILGLKDK